MTCGNGIQRLQAVCRKQGDGGGHQTVDPERCPPTARPARVRPCSLRPCDSKRRPLLLLCRNRTRNRITTFFFLADSVRPDPTILAQRKVYIQWRKARKLQLLVGGYAYLLPWTTVVLRCPTRHFRKGHIQWLKDGKPLVVFPHLSITPPGYVKIQQLRASDAGVYTCVAGSAQEHFVLRMIGGKQKLSPPESWRLSAGQRAAGETFQELSVSLNQYDEIVKRLLELRGSVQEEKDTDKPQPSDKNRAALEEESSEPSGLFVLAADTRRLDELTHDLSEGLGGPWGEQLIAQLLSELTVTRGDTNESTLHPPENTESSTQGPLLYKPDAKAHASRPRSPVIIQRSGKVEAAPSSDMTVHVGVPVLLQKPVSGLELRCEVLGSPEPSLTWTKNGKRLHYSSR